MKNKLSKLLYVASFAYVVAYQYGYVKGVDTATKQFNETTRTFDRRYKRGRPV